MVGIYNEIYSIIVPATQANFTAHTYTNLYSSVATTVTINGQAVDLAAGSQLGIRIRSISATPGVYLIGNNFNNSSDAVILG